MDSLKSTLYDLSDIAKDNLQFNIPRYQRLYVWKDEQVETFFHDIYTSAMVGKEMYYIGGVILVKNKHNAALFDVVDGQQRFTTLWLILNELKGLFPFELKLRFAIRPKVERYFKFLSDYTDYSSEQGNEFEDLVRIDYARRKIKELINSKLKNEEEKQHFALFLAAKVKLIITTVPIDTDLNKLFETLNNRGEQLLQSEILKSRILSGINNVKSRSMYGSIWNACSDTGNYLERSLGLECRRATFVADCHDKWKYDYKAIKSLFDNSKTSKVEPKNLMDILANPFDQTGNVNGGDRIEPDYHPQASDDEFQKVRSVLNFSQILLHTLRIFRYKNNESDIHRINEKELLKTFDEYFFPGKPVVLEGEKKEFEKRCKEFIDLLFKIREVFDKYVVKWVEIDTNEEELMIKRTHKQTQKKGSWTYYLRREITDQYDGLSKLQTILYHSQQNTTQYWLTPYLFWLLKHPSFDDAYDWLKKLDNILFCTNRDAELLTDRTWECMNDYPDHQIDYSILHEKSGTGFPHYWFYKMDFILWHEREELDKSEWKKYKITAKNSIEHIGPQHPKNPKDKVCTKNLHGMGNLVLVTRSINSEYSDLPFSVKRAKFNDKKDNGFYDSLKSDLIYENNSWNDEKAEAHQNKMLEIVEGYFNKTRV